MLPAVHATCCVRSGASQAQVDADYDALQRIMQDEQHSPGMGEILSSRKLRRMFHVGMGVMALQQLSGINTVMCVVTPDPDPDPDPAQEYPSPPTALL